MARIVRRGREYLENWRVNTGASGDSAGDILTFGQNEVFDADDKNKVGFDQGMQTKSLTWKKSLTLMSSAPAQQYQISKVEAWKIEANFGGLEPCAVSATYCLSPRGKSVPPIYVFLARECRLPHFR
jgi:hypothetical protein